jgi:hypothetical protein
LEKKHFQLIYGQYLPKIVALEDILVKKAVY